MVVGRPAEVDAGIPAQPIETFTTLRRQALPNVSVITTATSTPSRSVSASRRRSADPSGSSGNNDRNPASTFDASTPAFAQTKVARLGDHQVASTRHHPQGLSLDPRLPTVAL